METLFLTTLIAFGAFFIKSRDQKRRITLLGNHLGHYDIEKLMENLTEGYQRALGESDADRQGQVWNHLNTTEAALVAQFNRFVLEFAKVDEAGTRVSKIPMAIPYADTLFAGATFDLRKAFSIHARGISDAVNNRQQQSAKNKAFTLSAELFLMQHTCHWFCRSKAVASARMLARQKITYTQLVAAVSPDTRKAYCALTGDTP